MGGKFSRRTGEPVKQKDEEKEEESKNEKGKDRHVHGQDGITEQVRIVNPHNIPSLAKEEDFSLDNITTMDEPEVNCSHEGLLSLPPEVVLQIFQKLSHRSLCSVVLACKYLSQIGSDPDLWADMAINRLRVREGGMADFQAIPRFSKLRHLNLQDLGIEGGLHLWVKILTEVLLYTNTRAMEGKSLDSLDLTWARKLGDVSTELLAMALPKVRCLTIAATNLSKFQIDAILEKIPDSDIIEELTLHENLGAHHCEDQRKVDANLLAEAFCSLRKVDVDSSDMNSLQIIALFSRSLTSDTLEELSMYDCSHGLGEVRSELLNKAVCRLRKINLGYCLGYGIGYNEGSHQQITTFFTALPTSTTLESVKLYNHDMSQIDPVIMARAACHLSSIELRYLRLTTSHLNEIVRCRINENENLMELDISQNDFTDLTSTECNLLGQAIGRMRKVNLDETNLSNQQISLIVNAIQELGGEERLLTWDNLIY